MKIAIGSDHAGYELKTAIIDALKGDNMEFEDFGTHSTVSVDYPDYAHAVANSVESGQNVLGIVICGSANGVCMSANKHAGIRCALSWNREIAALARQHNDANILALPARFLEVSEAISIVRAFLNAEFEGGRHQRRVEKI